MNLKKNIKNILLSTVLLASPFCYAENIGDISHVEGAINNSLQGFGFVVGLPNTGDRGNFTSSNLKTLIQKYGIKVPESVNLNSKNIAFVAISATLPPCEKVGQTVDVTVSTIGNSKSLRGGTLLGSPLLGYNGVVYGVAQGQVLVDGISTQGMDGSSLEINTASVGRIPSGGTVEKELGCSSMFYNKTFKIDLNKSSFATVSAVESTINKAFGSGTAKALDAATVEIHAPQDTSQRIKFISMVNNLHIDMPKEPARVVINSRTGTVMIQGNITLAPVAISLGGIVINISEQSGVSQPEPFSNGKTIVTKNSQVSIKRKQGDMKYITKSATLQELVSTLNSISTSPKDMASIIQLLKSSGSLNADVIVN
ncbi:flagellar basal body P-ring protein FlgI [Photobacterium damselae]|uniref:flagellar basal body P-ring protein FlgI n=1 Tax=Photobacterium damselae TaxID=38293 RepID=UPI0040678505